MRLAELKPAEYNPRKDLQPGDLEYEKLKRSVEAFGCVEPIVWNRRSKCVVGGHQRLKVLLDLGIIEESVVVVDLAPEEEMTLNVALNKVSGDWDMPMLKDLLEELDSGAFDVSLTGFDLDEIENLMTQYHVEEATEAVDVVDAEMEPFSQNGDIYTLGCHRLMCGDATDAVDVVALMDGASGGGQTVLALTDPPYGINIVKGRQVGGNAPLSFKGKIGGGTKVKANLYNAVIGDESTDTAKNAFILMRNHSDNQIIFGGNYFTDFLPPSSCWIVWDKKITGNFADVELAWTSFNRAAKLYSWLWNGLSRKGDHKAEGKTRVHPTQKPVGMLCEILRDYSGRGDVILDLFGGSGSTLIACEQLNRQCRMMEITPNYCDVIVRRYVRYLRAHEKEPRVTLIRNGANMACPELV